MRSEGGPESSQIATLYSLNLSLRKLRRAELVHSLFLQRDCTAAGLNLNRVILKFSSSLQQEAAPKVDTPFFDMAEKSIFSKNARRCIACTITAGINIPAKGHKGLCTEAMIYAGKEPTFLRELKHLEGLYDASVHDSMTREQALEVLSSAYEIAK